MQIRQIIWIITKILKAGEEGGVIAIDNVLWSGAVINSEINDNDFKRNKGAKRFFSPR